MFRMTTLAAAACALAACATNGYDPYADPSPEEAPALWAVSDDDNTVYLFGTFHLLPPGTDWRRPAFEQAMAETAFTYVEADANSPEAAARIGQLVQQYGLNPEGVTLSGTLGPERTAQFEAFLAPYGIPMAALEPLKPWLAIVSVTQAAYASAGLDAASGVEPAILAIAATQGDEVAYLETAETQILALSRLDVDELLASFDVSLDQLVNLEDMILEGVEAWRVGDVDALDSVLLEDTRKQAPNAYNVIFIERNANWTEQIDQMMAGDEDKFLAVGAGHLVGPGSVIEMLVEKGYRPVRLQ